jgi:hypothetical protein
MQPKPMTGAEREELKKKYGPKVLTKQIPGQQMLMARKTSSSSRESFTYGNFEEVYPITFEFVTSIGGYSGAPLQTPPHGREWIRWKHMTWEVKKADLDGSFRDAD